MVVIDASAWVEYFDGTKAGKKVADILDNKENEIHVNVITIAELAGLYKKKNISFEEPKKILFSMSSIYTINTPFAEEAGVLYAELRPSRKKLSLADAFVLLTAKKLSAKLVTGDEDFRGMKEVVMIR